MCTSIDRLQWNDRVYGDSVVDDQGLLALIDCPTYQRLQGIKQAGPSALAFPFKQVTRFEHCLGVYLLLRRLGATRREQVAGLLHDLSHTAFSHAVDFIYESDEQNHHEDLKPRFLRRPDILEALGRLGYGPEEFDDDSIYPILERRLPRLCADRVDYFLRDSLACGVTDRPTATVILNHLTVVGDEIVFTDISIAQKAADLFAVMNRDWWASPTEAFIYNEFAEVIRRGFHLGLLQERDLLEDDTTVLTKLDQSEDPKIFGSLARIRNFNPSYLDGYEVKVPPKVRWIDPMVQSGAKLCALSECD